MSSYVLLKVANNFYCYSVENVQRVIDFPKLVPLPDAKDYVDGIMSYEIDSTKASAVKVINFRKLISQNKIEEDLINFLNGNFIDEYYHEVLSKIYPKLSSDKKLSENMHLVLNFLTTKNRNPSKEITSSIHFIVQNIYQITNKYQKCILIDEGRELFALCVDEIEKILYIDDDLIHKKNSNDNNMLKIKGIAEIENKLVYVIDSIGI